MGFASEWLEKKSLFPELINEMPDNQTGIIIVIPAYNEPRIRIVLDSIIGCTPPGCSVEVLIIINAPADAGNDALLNNQLCLKNILNWKEENPECFFSLYAYDAGKPSIKGWGVGPARKTGMDEALRRFNIISEPEGVIVNLDADCRVEKNYLTAIYHKLYKDKKRNACSIYFEHPDKGDDYQDAIYRSIIQYELHLRYFLQALKFSGFPNAFHTVGSAMAVKAFQYFKSGGMNRRQAGEDFYFIQKLIPMEGYFTLNSTTVYPSPRESLRVPFGTGATVQRMMATGEVSLLTYNTEAFMELRFLFDMLPDLYNSKGNMLKEYYMMLPAGIRSFIVRDKWISEISSILTNTSSEKSFSKRFFGWFNMFMIVKYLNHVHKGIFTKQPVMVSAMSLLTLSGNCINMENMPELLDFYRKMEKE